MKRLLAVLVVMVVPFLAVPRALADKPTITRTVIDTEFVVEDQCAFPVDVHETGVLIDIVTTDEDGTVHDFEAFPRGTAVLTNADNGHSLILNISGPGRFTFYEDGSFSINGTGLWLFWPYPGTGEPGLFLTSGHFLLSVDSQGNTTFALTGRAVDICSQLA
jgi:hypothetical protein